MVDPNMSGAAKARVAILISGRGSNMAALIDAAREPGYPAEIVGVVASSASAGGLKIAESKRVPAIAVDREAFPDRAAFETALNAALDKLAPDVIACAGFMLVFSPAFVERWHDRLINIHPSLLPAFKGLDTHARALAAGVRITGCTVHLVRTKIDDGPIIAQAAVPVLEGDTTESLGARVLAAEHRLYAHALTLYLALYMSKSDGPGRGGAQVTVNQQKALFSPPLGAGGPGCGESD
jgi:phosphoribosylglycinamide formyltransferase-1